MIAYLNKLEQVELWVHISKEELLLSMQKIIIDYLQNTSTGIHNIKFDKMQLLYIPSFSVSSEREYKTCNNVEM